MGQKRLRITDLQLSFERYCYKLTNIVQRTSQTHLNQREVAAFFAKLKRRQSLYGCNQCKESRMCSVVTHSHINDYWAASQQVIRVK